ncbi:MAG: hypothetical protein WHV66_13670 [Anaerolineales bacterium]
MSYRNVLLATAILTLMVTACTPATPVAPQVVEVTRVVPQTVVVTQIVEIEKIIIATSEPTQTVQETITAEPQATPDNQPVFSAWCTKQFTSPQDVAQNGQAAQDADIAYEEDGKLILHTERSYCAFFFTFDTELPKGVHLDFYDTRPDPWASLELTPTTSNPAMGYALSNNPYIVNPPYWEITYKLSLKDSNGKELWNRDVTFKRSWTPKPCYGGMWPDAATLKCPALPEVHPWDPWYGYDTPYDGKPGNLQEDCGNDPSC